MLADVIGHHTCTQIDTMHNTCVTEIFRKVEPDSCPFTSYEPTDPGTGLFADVVSLLLANIFSFLQHRCVFVQFYSVLCGLRTLSPWFDTPTVW